MHSQHRFILGLLAIAGGCSRLIDSDAPYVLNESGSSQSTAGGAGATGGAGGSSGSGGGPSCKTNDDCPSMGSMCTTTECVEGSCQTKPTLSGTPCNPGTPHVCDGQGVCVECAAPVHCVDIVEDQCTKRACVSNVCQTKYLGAESPASPALQQPGDCKIVVCNGAGGTKPVNDDTDTPDDNNGCTTDTCLNGSEVHTKVAVQTNCGTNSYCDEVGQCVGCLTAADCSGSYDFCKQRTCMNGICGISYTADGSALPANDQSAQDCFIVVCDGAGNIVTRVETSDFPIDNNACTVDLCGSDGTPSHPSAPISTKCGDGVNDTCDGMGTCKQPNGKSCSTDSECLSAYCVDGVCCDSACNETCRACNVSPMTVGTCTAILWGQEDGNATMTCTGSSSCDGNGVCKKDNGQSCSTVNDCVHGICVDGYCCESACTTTCKACNVSGSLGVCANIPVGSKDDDASPVCNGSQACNGNGTCKLANGQSCSSPSQCASGKCAGGPKACQP